jgi:hypothetical protein
LSFSRSAGRIVALTLRVRVRTAPEKPSADLVKVPMVAMMISSCVARAAPIAASMAIESRGTIAPQRQAWSAAKDGGAPAFLLRDAKPGSPAAEKGRRPALWCIDRGDSRSFG